MAKVQVHYVVVAREYDGYLGKRYNQKQDVAKFFDAAPAEKHRDLVAAKLRADEEGQAEAKTKLVALVEQREEDEEAQHEAHRKAAPR